MRFKQQFKQYDGVQWHCIIVRLYRFKTAVIMRIHVKTKAVY